MVGGILRWPGEGEFPALSPSPVSIFRTRTWKVRPRPLTHAQVDKAQGLVRVILALPLPSPGCSTPRWLITPGAGLDLLLPQPSPPSLPKHLPSRIECVNSFPVSWDCGCETAYVGCHPQVLYYFSGVTCLLWTSDSPWITPPPQFPVPKSQLTCEASPECCGWQKVKQEGSKLESLMNLLGAVAG